MKMQHLLVEGYCDRTISEEIHPCENTFAVMPNKAGGHDSPPASASPLPLRLAPVCAVLLRWMGGFGGGFDKKHSRWFWQE